MSKILSRVLPTLRYHQSQVGKVPVTTRIPFSSPPNAGAYDCSEEYVKVMPRVQGKPPFWRHKDTGVVLHQDPVAKASVNTYYVHDDNDGDLTVLSQSSPQVSDQRETDNLRISERRPVKTDLQSAHGGFGQPTLSQLLSDRLSLATYSPQQNQNQIASLHIEVRANSRFFPCNNFISCVSPLHKTFSQSTYLT